jgi:hypothetical protein
MLHRRMIETTLTSLEGERANYFAQVLQRLDEDPRVELAPNIIFLVLKEILPLCPTYLSARELVDRLLEFVAVNQVRINRAIFDPAYLEDPKGKSEMRKIGGEFINQILSATLKKMNAGELNTNERQVYRFSSDEDPSDFPYRDEDDDLSTT